MATFLFTWNPNNWHWENLDQQIKIRDRVGVVREAWSCGVSKRIRPGDRAFLLCQGRGPRGIVGSGVVATEQVDDKHWGKGKAKRGKASYVEIDWDALINPNKNVIFERSRLNQPAFSEMFWDAQSSGTQIPDAVAKRLEAAWARFRGVAIAPTVQHVKSAIIVSPGFSPTPKSGAGFGTAASNRAVEKAGILAATKHFKAKRWQVTSVESSNCGYDLRCTLRNVSKHVEVKGIKGKGEQFFITANELATARIDPAYELCLVLQAGSPRPQLKHYSAKELLRSFQLEPLTYSARQRTR